MLPRAWRRAGIQRFKGQPERAQARAVHQGDVSERKQMQALLGEARKLLQGNEASSSDLRLRFE